MRCRCRRTLVYLRGRDCGAHAVNTLQTTDCVCTMDAARTLRDTPCASLRVAAQQALVLVSHLQLGEGYRGMHGARVLFSNHPGSGRFHRTPANPTPRPVHHMNLKPKTATNRS